MRRVSGDVMWANTHLLFWLDEHPRQAVPTALYGFVMLMTAAAWYVMQALLLREDSNGTLRAAIRNDRKAKIAPVLYLAGIACAWFAPPIADIFYVVVAGIWLVPDRRTERAISEKHIESPK